MSFCSLSESLEPLVHTRPTRTERCMHSHSLPFSVPQSLCHTPGRLVKNILEMQTFIPFTSNQCGLSKPECYGVAVVFLSGLCQSSHPLPLHFSYCTPALACWALMTIIRCIHNKWKPLNKQREVQQGMLFSLLRHLRGFFFPVGMEPEMSTSPINRRPWVNHSLSN